MNTSLLRKVTSAVAALSILVLIISVSRIQGVATQKVVATAAYSCDGNAGIVATYYARDTKQDPSPDAAPQPNGSVALTLSDGRSLTFPQTLSADGARYASADDAFVFWGKGNRALVEEHGAESAFTGCIVVADAPAGVELPLVYSSGARGFSLRLPTGYTVDEVYRYAEQGSGKGIQGVKFTIASSTARGTNLGADTHASVEQVEATSTDCSAALFLERVKPVLIEDGDVTYSIASSTDAGAGNRYEETVYALPGTSPCTAVRYYIHTTVFENYPAGSVTRYDAAALRAAFDAIRHTLVLAH